MEMTHERRSKSSEVLKRVRALLPEIWQRADEIEAAVSVPRDLLTKIEEAGAFRICLPARWGGEELPYAEVSEIIESVAKADASTAWHIMVAAGTQIMISHLPTETVDGFYSQDPNIWAKAAGTPKGVAVPVEGGYRLSGRWPLASGAGPFEWIGLGFLIKDPDGVRKAPSGAPDFRFGLVPRGNAKIIETWDAVGLRGTRSDDIEVEDVFVPEAWQGPTFGPSAIRARTVGISFPFCTAPLHNAIVTGILKAAIAELIDASLTRRPAFNPATLMKDDPVFRDRFGQIASRADALFALSKQSIRNLDRCDDEKRDLLPMEGAQILAWESLIHHEATALMDQIMALSGSAGVYSSNPQQRRWRDLRCVAQHQVANIGNFGRYTVALVEEASGASSKGGTLYQPTERT